MKKIFQIMVTTMAIFMIYFVLFPSFLSSIPVVIIGAVLIYGITNVENRPPQIGILTRLNKKIWAEDQKPVIVKEGYNWIFLKGILYDLLLISSERRILSLNPQNVLTPDNVDIQIPISLEWNLDEKNLDTFIEIGEDKGVQEHITDILEGVLREYSRDPKEGPMAWKEMIGSNLKIIDFLVKSLSPSQDNPPDDGYDHLIKINDNIPTPILFDWYFRKNPSNYVVRKEYGDGKNWDDPWSNNFNDNWFILLNKINQLGLNIITLRGKIENRENLLKKIKGGKANIKVANSGAILKRLTVGDVKPFGDIYLADIELQKEERQRTSETYDVETDLRKAELLKIALQNNGASNVSFHDCYNAIMKWKNFKPGTGFIYEGSLGGIAGIGAIISNIMKGGKS